MQDYENVKLSKEDIRKNAHYEELGEEELDSIIEMVWQYSIIAYNAYNKSNKATIYE